MSAESLDPWSAQPDPGSPPPPFDIGEPAGSRFEAVEPSDPIERARRAETVRDQAVELARELLGEVERLSDELTTHLRTRPARGHDVLAAVVPSAPGRRQAWAGRLGEIAGRAEA